MAFESSPEHKSRHSHKSRSASGERRRRHRSHSRERSDRGHRDGERRRRSKSRDRERDDKDRERRRRHDGERERRHRDRDRSGHRERSKRDREHDGEDKERKERRRKRDEEPVVDEGHKRPRPDIEEENGSERASRRARSRDSDRRSVRSGRGGRDPRDEFDAPMRLPRGDRERDEYSRRSPHYEDKRRSPPPPPRNPSPDYGAPVDPYLEDPKEDDSEQRSVFVSQLAARMTARDLGYFFEDKLGENSVMDSRIVTDRLSRRSKGIAYVEFRTVELVDQAIALSGTIVMGLPIMVQHTEAERNKTHAGDGSINLPPGASGRGATLYVGSLHFSLTESDIQQVFEPFGELDFVDLHKDPSTGRSKGYAFVHYKHADNAKMALDQMEGFELAGRQLKVNTVHEKGGQTRIASYDILDESGGGNLNAASRQALMHKLARMDSAPVASQPEYKPVVTQSMTSKCVLLRNMFDLGTEDGANWDKELADEVKEECQSKYGKIQHIKVERDSEGEIYVQFDSIDSATDAVKGLDMRWFGGRQITATFISDAIMQAHR